MLSEVTIQFDETNKLLIYPSAVGIKFVDINSSKVILKSSYIFFRSKELLEKLKVQIDL